MSIDTPAPRFIVGIDLGTTNCAVAFIDTAAGDDERREERWLLLGRCAFSSAFSRDSGRRCPEGADEGRRLAPAWPLTRRCAPPSPRFAGRGVSREILRPACGEKVPRSGG